MLHRLHSERGTKRNVKRAHYRSYQEVHRQKQLRIGVFGLHPNAGATFVSLLCAEFLSGIKGEHVIIAERANRWELKLLSECCIHRNRKEESIVTLHGITLVSAEEHKEYIDCLNKTDSCMIYDLGCCYPIAKECMNQCHILIFVFHLCEWKFSLEKLKIQLASAWFQEISKTKKTILLGNLSTPEKRNKQYYGLPAINYLGYEPNVYVPSVQARALFDELIFDDLEMVRD